MLSARVAGGRSRILGQESAEVEELVRADLARMAKERGVEAWEQFKGPPPMEMGTQPKDLVDTRWVLTWK